MRLLALLFLTSDRFPLGFEVGFDLTGAFPLFLSLKGSELFGFGDLFLTRYCGEVGLEILLIDQNVDDFPKRRDGGFGSKIHFGFGRFDHQYSDGIAVIFVVIGKAVEATVVLLAVALPSVGDMCRTGLAADLKSWILGFDTGAAFDHFFEDGVDLLGSLCTDSSVVTVFWLQGMAGAIDVGDVVENMRSDGDSTVIERAVGFEHLGKRNGHSITVSLVGTVDFVPEEFG